MWNEKKIGSFSFLMLTFLTDSRNSNPSFEYPQAVKNKLSHIS